MQKISSPANAKTAATPSFDENLKGDFNAKWASAMLQMHNDKISEFEKFLAITQDKALKALIGIALPKLRTHKEMLLKIPGVKNLQDTRRGRRSFLTNQEVILTGCCTLTTQ